jgi:hypothetical protein
MLPIRAAAPLIVCSSLILAVIGCNRGADSGQSSATSADSAQATNVGAPPTVRGTVESVSANSLVINSDTGAVTVAIEKPFRLYTRVPTDMSQVKQGSFIGVTTVKQPDGSERATEIHIFPEELRGLGEGSRMMTSTGSGGSRMTNGSVSPSRMTNGTASPSRMSNGSVSSANGSSLVVQYAGGSQNVTVPPNTPVTELKIASRNLAVGDQVAVLVKKASDGSLTADKAISTAN